MSPLGAAFRERVRKFPSIVNCCTIDWFSEWPDEALQSVATRAFAESDMNLGDHLESVTDVCKYMHMHVASTSREFLERLGRSNYVTPTSYLELLGTYKKVRGCVRACECACEFGRKGMGGREPVRSGSVYDSSSDHVFGDNKGSLLSPRAPTLLSSPPPATCFHLS